MGSLFKWKNYTMGPLIRWGLHHPNVMKSRLFLKVMQVFPEKISRTYDAKIRDGREADLLLLAAGLDLLERQPLQILDLCTGTGLAAFEAAKHFPNAFVTGVDQSPGMIEAAKSKVKESDVLRICFEQGNAVALAIEKETYDLVVTSNAPVYLAEAVRVLKSEGYLLIVFSFGGKVFTDAERDVRNLLKINSLDLLHLKRVGEGIVILAGKSQAAQKL
ncbi:MAG TPA: class I SAM-dependent methyltransferase [Anaerovoracaceae bacterium]|nr:class I SAM-dependent methyltransferase [Eubacteriales bacterium]HPF19584.1 class I SAM-dependent methyltransferase [Bacillota bacterium]HRV32860.1 class I SAM-dependent methyltransferase [Anaerovoracaceae bacterium]